VTKRVHCSVVRTMSSHSSKQSCFQLASVRVLFALAVIVTGCTIIPNHISTASAQTAEHPVFFPTTIRWSKQRGVTKYRLQIADDKGFRNVLFDVRLVGGPHTVCWLAPGYYYWRVAPSSGKTGAFLKPVKFFVSGGVNVSIRRRRSRGARRVPQAISAAGVRSRGLKNVGS
jgi:hypothetical protein